MQNRISGSGSGCVRSNVHTDIALQCVTIKESRSSVLVKNAIYNYVQVLGTGYSLEAQSLSLKASMDSAWTVSAGSLFQSTTVRGKKLNL